MRLLVACEYSATVRDAFAALGFDAWSCDLLPSEKPGNHIQGDVIPELDKGWDLLIGHPPCTDLSVSGARWFKDKVYEQPKAIQFFHILWTANIPRICLENPVSVISRYVGKPTQTIQPYQFECPETKRTCLWLKNLPPLVPTSNLTKREARVHLMPPSEDRGKERARMPQGIANAMAKQWGMKLIAGLL